MAPNLEKQLLDQFSGNPLKTQNHITRKESEDFSLLVAFLLVTFSWLFRGPLLSRKTVFGPFFVTFSWFFRGPRFGQILRVLALEQSSERKHTRKNHIRFPKPAG